MLSTNTNAIVTRSEDVSNYVIGYFGDSRLQKVGALLFKMISQKMTTCIHKLSNGRAMQVAFNRFLSNEKCTTNEIELSLSSITNENCNNKDHVLCVQDTIEVNYSKHPMKKINFGVNRSKKKSDQDIKGFLAHPSLILDAKNADILGLSSVKVWTRNKDNKDVTRHSPIEDKESYKWIETVEKVKENITNAKIITVIGDRESDIYELFDRRQNQNIHLIVRSMHNRKLTSGAKISEHMNEVTSEGTYDINLPPITGVRKARKATIAVKYSLLQLKTPSNVDSNNSSTTMTCVEACEISSIPGKEKPVFWRLLTTHEVNNFLDAKDIITWYTWRWNIEQVFRTMKKKGLKIEDSEIEKTDDLLKLFVLSIAAAVKVLCLVNARDGTTKRPANDIFSKDELSLLVALLVKVNGRTKKQQNPHRHLSLSWASWIIARLGGWNGYACESPPGPITMYSGLEVFYKYAEGWQLAQ